MSSERGKKRGDEMVMTTLRVSRRTARMASYIAGALGVNSDKSVTADEVVWDALNKAYPSLVGNAGELPRIEVDEKSES